MLPGIDPYRNDNDDENENDGNKDDFYGGLSSLFFSLSQYLFCSLSIYPSIFISFVYQGCFY